MELKNAVLLLFFLLFLQSETIVYYIWNYETSVANH